MTNIRRRRHPCATLDPVRSVAIAMAESAADAATRLASRVSIWIARAGLPAEEAAEAHRAAGRARAAAAAAARTDDTAGAWDQARTAWAALATVEEADARVTAAIARSITGE